MTEHLTNKHAILRIMARPNDVNVAGDVFGGWMMSQCDIAGSIVARQRAGGRVVTVAVKEFLFIAPVLVGDIVSIYADVKKLGRTSISIQIQVIAERPLVANSPVIEVASAEIIYVHINESRQPKPLPVNT
jgi:acyl-CoA thioesterase YciA